MTREKAIGNLIHAIRWNDMPKKEALDMAIQALEQEPCDDAISRQAVLEAIDVKAWEFCDYLISKNRNDEQKPVSHFADNLRECVREELPSAKPQEPKAVLYSGDGYADGYMVYDMAECPNCGYEYDYGDKDWGLPFCPNCSQKLNWERSEE